MSKFNNFKYKVFSLLLDLSELEVLDKKINFFSFNKFNLISFHEDGIKSSIEMLRSLND